MQDNHKSKPDQNDIEWGSSLWEKSGYAAAKATEVDKTGWVHPGANGKMPINLGILGRFASMEIYGGPFRNFKPPVGHNSFGVCLLERDMITSDLHMPIQDFGVPTQTAEEVTKVLVMAYAKALRGKVVYAGCMGGIGRTGIFLSLMAKIAGYSDPVSYVRSTFLPQAVETQRQEAYIKAFDVGPAQRAVYFDAWKSLIFRN